MEPTDTKTSTLTKNQNAFNSKSLQSYLEDCCFDIQANPNLLSGSETYLIKILSKIAVGSATVWWSILELKQFIKNRQSI